MPIVPRPTANAPPDKQLELALAIEHAPHIVRRHGLVETHAHPRVSHGQPYWRMHRVPAPCAWRYAELELDSATAQVALILDVDHDDAQHYLGIALGGTLHTPNWVCSSPRGHAHVVYALTTPVLRTEAARRRPLALLGRVAEYYTQVYDADTAYRAVLTHNPVHPRYAGSTTWLREPPYSLTELAEVIPHSWRLPAKPRTIEGRNCTLFRAAMRFFGQPSQWDASTNPDVVHAWIAGKFREWYPGPQPGWHPNENRWIAKSVSRICTKNLSAGQTQRQAQLDQG